MLLRRGLLGLAGRIRDTPSAGRAQRSVAFVERGRHALKGVPGEWLVLAVAERQAASP
jgi:hypothetical protein